MARTTLGSIIDELVTIQNTLSNTEAVYDEIPENIAATPAWINFPLAGELNEISDGLSEDQHTIGCAYCTYRSILPRDDALIRPMVTAFPDKLSQNLTLNGAVTHIDSVEYEYGEIELLSSPEQVMIGILFRIQVTVKDGITISV
jgi:hypothetical protein